MKTSVKGVCNAHRGAKLLGRDRGHRWGGKGCGIGQLRVQCVGLIWREPVCAWRTIWGRWLEVCPLLRAVIHPAENSHKRGVLLLFIL